MMDIVLMIGPDQIQKILVNFLMWFYIASYVRTLEKMKRKILRSFDNISLEQIQKYVTTSYLFQF